MEIETWIVIADRCYGIEDAIMSMKGDVMIVIGRIASDDHVHEVFG